MTTSTAATPTFRKRAKLTAIIAVSVALVALVEIALRIALPTADWLHAELREHPQLGLMIAPYDHGHDANGFRNPSVPDRVDVVAVGDSFTYGNNATQRDNWPGHLQSMLGRSVYNTGMGGFGPLQELHVIEHVAPKLAPQLAVLAIYMGNDIADAYNLTQVRPHWYAWRRSARVEGGLTELDREGARLWDAQQDSRVFGDVRDWLAQHSMTYAVARHALLTSLARWRGTGVAAGTEPDERMAWSDPRHPLVRTVFGARLRWMSLDTSRPEIEEGVQITMAALRAMAGVTQSQGVRLVVVVMPTKERVYCKVLEATAAVLPPSHRALCAGESKVAMRLIEAARAAGLTAEDTTPALERAAMKGDVLFMPNDDAHFVAAGYRIVAMEIARAIGSPPDR